MDLRTGELLQILSKGEKCEYAFLFPKGAPVEEAIEALDRFKQLMDDLVKERDEKEAEESSEESQEEEVKSEDKAE